jgi:hypothetical protein
MDISIILPWAATLKQSSIQTASTIATVIISLFALGLGLINFWWSNYRIGKIKVSDPLLYALSLGHSEPKSIEMQIPLAFLNTGGATRFIQDLKLILQQNGKESNELFFERQSLSFYSDDNERSDDHLAQQFVIEGHKAYSAIFYFYRKPGNFCPSAGTCKAKLKSKVDKEDWKSLHEFDFKIGDNQDLHVLSPHHLDNREFPEI